MAVNRFTCSRKGLTFTNSVKMFIIAREEIQMTSAEISKMSVLERLQAMEALWDSLGYEPTDIKSPK